MSSASTTLICGSTLVVTSREGSRIVGVETHVNPSTPAEEAVMVVLLVTISSDVASRTTGSALVSTRGTPSVPDEVEVEAVA